jgi:hypothetical protein
MAARVRSSLQLATVEVLTFGLEIGPKLEDWFLKLGVVLS